jgi:hypothetical protein
MMPRYGRLHFGGFCSWVGLVKLESILNNGYSSLLKYNPFFFKKKKKKMASVRHEMCMRAFAVMMNLSIAPFDA